MIGTGQGLLKHRVLLVLAALLAVHLIFSVVIGWVQILPRFEELERGQALTDLERCVNGFEGELRHLASLCSDWAVWDDTYRFVLDGNAEYVRSNLSAETLQASGIDLIFIIDNSGVVQGRVMQTRGSGDELHLKAFPDTQWDPSHKLLCHTTPESEIRGWSLSEAGPVMLVARPIVTSQMEGPIRGTLVMGRFVDNELLLQLQHDLDVALFLRELWGNSVEDRAVVKRLEEAGGKLLEASDEDHLRGVTLIKDLHGNPALLLTAVLPREVTPKGILALKYAVGSNIVAGCVLLIAVYWLMQRVVLKRIVELQRAVASVDASGDLSMRLPVDGQDELSALAVRLNQMLASTEASEQALRQSQAAAEEANRLKSRFVSNVSHEIRTPMNGIVGFCDAILGCNSLEQAKQHAWAALRESNVMLMLISDLLDLARLESGKLVLEHTAVDLVRLLDELRQSAAVQARAKGLDFSIELAPEVPLRIASDPLRLRQMLLNLIANAIKFTEHGEVRVSVQHAPAKFGRRLRFAVRDTGIGIPEHKHKQLFQTFSQMDPSTTRTYGGSGLGLAIVRQLVELFGGEVGVESTPGHGSLFWFAVPVEVLPELPGEGPATVAPVRKEPDTPVIRAHVAASVLLAEDYPTNQQVIRLFLEQAGYHVTLANNGQEAVDACEQQVFDLILLDLQMPVMDGSEAAQRIRQGATPNATVPIVALTASADAETRTRCLRIGMNEVVTKPVRQQALLAVVAGQVEGTAAPPAQAPEQAEAQVAPVPPIDMKMAIDEFGGAEAVEQILAQFLAEATQQVGELRSALAQGELEILRRAAHSMKGGAAMLEAAPLATAAGAVEDASAAGNQESLPGLVERLAEELRRLAEFAGPQLRAVGSRPNA